MSFPWWSDGLVGHLFQHLNLPLQVKVGGVIVRNERPSCSSGHVEILVNHGKLILHAAHHHHVLSHLWLHHHGWWGAIHGTSHHRSRWGTVATLHTFHCARLLESAVSHLYLTKLVIRIGSHVWAHGHVADRLIGETLNKPGVFHWRHCWMWTELLHVSISERSIISLWELNELLFPSVSALNGLVLHVTLRPHCFESGVTLKARGITEGSHWLRWLKWGLWGSIMAKVIILSDTLDNITSGKLNVCHSLVIDCYTWGIQVGLLLLDLIPIVVLHHGPLNPIHGEGVGGLLALRVTFLHHHS